MIVLAIIAIVLSLSFQLYLMKKLRKLLGID